MTGTESTSCLTASSCLKIICSPVWTAMLVPETVRMGQREPNHVTFTLSRPMHDTNGNSVR